MLSTKRSGDTQKTKEIEWIEVEGFKGLPKDLVAYNDFQYEIGKTYECDGEITICKNGFHFCLNLADVLDYMPLNSSNRYFKVKAFVDKNMLQNYGNLSSYFLGRRNKLVAKKLTLIEEISDEELFQFFKKEYSLKGHLDNIEIFKNFRMSNLSSRDFIQFYYTNVLKDIGYSITLANILVEQWILERGIEICIRNTELAIGLMEQKDLSADMRMYLLLQEANK